MKTEQEIEKLATDYSNFSKEIGLKYIEYTLEKIAFSKGYLRCQQDMSNEIKQLENRIECLYEVFMGAKQLTFPAIRENKSSFEDGDPNNYKVCPYCQDSFYATHLSQKYCKKKFDKEGYCKEKMKNIKRLENIKRKM